MSETTSALERKAASLREAFDRRFAFPPEPAAEKSGVLAIKVREDAYVIRIQDIGGIEYGRKIVRLPGSKPALRGLAGIRGRLVAVYSLGALLENPGAGASEPWLAICGARREVALSFSTLEGFFNAGMDCFHAVQPGQEARKHVPQVFRATAWSGGVLDLPAMLRDIDGAAPAREAH